MKFLIFNKKIFFKEKFIFIQSSLITYAFSYTFWQLNFYSLHIAMQRFSLVFKFANTNSLPMQRFNNFYFTQMKYKFKDFN